MKYINQSRGLVKGIVIVLLMAAFLFVGYLSVKPFYRYMTLRSLTKDILMMELGNLETVKKEIMITAKDLDVPLNANNLKIYMHKKVVKVNAQWSETVDYWGYYQKRFDFTMDVEY